MRSNIILAFAIASTPLSHAFQSLVSPSLSRARTLPLKSTADSGDGEMSWQESLEKLLNPFETNLGAKQIMFQDLVARREEVLKDVSDSLAAGKPEELFSQESPFREAATGVQALRRQVQDDLIPLVIEDAPGLVTTLVGKTVSSAPSAIGSAAQKLQGGGGGGSMADTLPPLSEVPKLLADELQNVVSPMPVGLETPGYTVALKGDGFEVRDYEAYAIAGTGMGVREESKSGLYTGGTFTSESASDGGYEVDDSETDPDDSVFRGSFGGSSSSSSSSSSSTRREELGEGAQAVEEVAASSAAFQTLASYLFGDNDRNEVMSMTTPVLTSYKGKRAAKMAFVLPSSSSSSSSSSAFTEGEAAEVETAAADATAASAPRPNSARVVVSAKTPQRVAVRTFQGLATPGEIRRQLLALKEALGMAGLSVEDTPTGEDWYSVLQYNPPTTLPFLRRNEISIRLRTDDMESTDGAPQAQNESEGSVEEEEEVYGTDEENGLPSD